MSRWEKIKVLDKNEYKSFYDEELGLIVEIVIHVALVDKEGKSFGHVYANRDSSGKVTDNNLYLVSNYNIDTIFDTEFYKPKQSVQPSWYRAPNFINIASAELITDRRFLVNIEFRAITRDRRGDVTTVRKKKKEGFIISKKSDLDNEMIWATKEEIRSYYPVIWMDLKVGQKYFVVDKGVCEVTKVYDYPVKGVDSLCDVIYKDGTTETINRSDNRFGYIPLDVVNELDQFNDSLNEIHLQPLLSRHPERDLINIMWQPIDDAARYIVKLYKYVNKANRREVYFMKDYIAERNEHFVAIKDIVSSIYSECIIVVTAENREGEIIARSRGIAASGEEPKWW